MQFEQRSSRRERWTTGLLGLLLGLGLGLTHMPPNGAQADPAAQPTGRIVVGLKQPTSPPVVRAVAKALRAKVVSVAPGRAYVLLSPSAKRLSLTQMRHAHPAIAYVEAEVVMGTTPESGALLMVIPGRRQAAR